MEVIPSHLLPSHLGGEDVKKKRGRPPKSTVETQKLTPAIVKLCEKLRKINGYADKIKNDQVTIDEVCQRLDGARSTVAKMVKAVKDGGYDKWLKQKAS